jgi:hypothetical protein
MMMAREKMTRTLSPSTETDSISLPASSMLLLSMRKPS